MHILEEIATTFSGLHAALEKAEETVKALLQVEQAKLRDAQHSEEEQAKKAEIAIREAKVASWELSEAHEKQRNAEARVDKLTEKLQTKYDEIKSLDEELRKFERKLEEKRRDAKEMEAYVDKLEARLQKDRDNSRLAILDADKEEDCPGKPRQDSRARSHSEEDAGKAKAAKQPIGTSRSVASRSRSKVRSGTHTSGGWQSREHQCNKREDRENCVRIDRKPESREGRKGHEREGRGRDNRNDCSREGRDHEDRYRADRERESRKCEDPPRESRGRAGCDGADRQERKQEERGSSRRRSPARRPQHSRPSRSVSTPPSSREPREERPRQRSTGRQQYRSRTPCSRRGERGDRRDDHVEKARFPSRRSSRSRSLSFRHAQGGCKGAGKGKGDRWCFFFILGKCRKGDVCGDRHPEEDEVKTIRDRFVQIACRYGKGCTRRDCVFNHPPKRSRSRSGDAKPEVD